MVIKKIQIVEIFKRFKQASPHPTTELKYTSGFEFLKDNWGACFIIGAKRNKYGIVKFINKCFVNELQNHHKGNLNAKRY